MVTTEMLERARMLAIQLKEIKAEEMELRREIVSEIAGDLDVGTHVLDRDGFKIKVRIGVSYGLVQDELQELIDTGQLTEEENDLVRIKYDLKLADYKKAGFNTDSLDEVIVVKPSAPSLDITLGE